MAIMQNLAALEGTGYYSINNEIVSDDATVTAITTYIDANSTVPVSDDDENFADKYVGTGKGAAVSFDGYTRGVNINLNYDSTVSLASLVTVSSSAYERMALGAVQFESVTAVRGSDGNTTVLGSSAAETIYAGSGDNTINGGGGRDVLIVDAADKYGSALFVFNEGDGKDTITGFEAYETESSLTADRIQVNDYTDVRLVNGNIRFSLNSSDQLTMVGVAGEKVVLNDRVAAIGTELDYEDVVGHYIGIEDATVTVGDHNGGINVWMNIGGLEGFEDLARFEDVKVFDMRGFYDNASVVGGYFEDNVIYAGSGTNSLWGGNGGDDTIYSGEGNTQYFYLRSDGNDVFEGVKDNEVVNLLNIGLEEIDFDGLQITGDAINVKFNESGGNGSLKINSSAEVVFQLQNGSQWSSDREGGWNYKGQGEV